MSSITGEEVTSNNAVAEPFTPRHEEERMYAKLDRLFRAPADATHRDIVARVLAGEPASISVLAARYDMSFAAVQRHVDVLETAGLVVKQRRGRERMVRGNPEQLARARDLLSGLEELWRSRFSQIDVFFRDTDHRE